VSGEPAQATLNDLVSQFSDRYAFIRELIQNSLDAGAVDIHIHMEAASGELVVTVEDDGEGMDRDTIEGYLLTLFRSTKEDDLTKIGKFGIGFVSLFAMTPYETIVDTGRDGIWHRVIFAEDRSWTLLKMDDPFEGTKVVLKTKRSRRQAAEDCVRIHAAASAWCRYADAEITTTATGIGQGWTDRPVAEAFTVTSPVRVTGSGDAWQAVVGISADPTPLVGFFNQGITLWEGPAAMLDGVTFRVQGRHLEHTLTRDNVRRDRHFDWIMDRVRDLALGPLAEAVHEALLDAVTDRSLAEVLYPHLSHSPVFHLRESAPIIPMVGREPDSMAALRPSTSWFSGLILSKPESTILVGRHDSTLCAAVADAGHRVLAGAVDDPRVQWLAHHLGGDEPVPVARAEHLWFQPRVTDDPTVQAAIEAAQAVSRRARYPWTLHVAEFRDGGERLRDRLAVRQPRVFELERNGAPLGVDVAVNARHPLAQTVSRLPAVHAGPLLLRAILVDLGLAEAPPDWLLPEASR